jgi:6-pyruvoyltetrahydropterin/6-carboxytetrahydropterin synthase
VKRVTWTKAYRFCAGHRLHWEDRDAAWNSRVFGKCSYPGGHGHNYVVEISIRGEPDPDSGLVVAEAAVDAAVESEIMAKLDHRNLNDALTQDFGPAPTTEVLVLELWRALERHVSPPTELYRILVSETSKNVFEYFGPAR